jgi:hypothetical protein
VKIQNHVTFYFNQFQRFFCRIGAVIVLTILTYDGRAQQFGGNPPRMKWRQINTDTVRVIFPENMGEQAQRVANTVHYLNSNHRETIGDNQKKIDIVLQNQTVISNGYVGLAPFRSELYMNAPQNSFDLGSNWLDLLSIHEYRHALQFMNTRRGLTKVASVLGGDLGWSYFSSLSIPNWFWEGDAIASETALTAQGRGRIPAFYNGFKSLVFDEKTYNYQKARNGSLNDYVPNHYELGFLLCNYGRSQYDASMWRNVVAESGKYRGLFYPFSQALKRNTQYGTKKFYEKSMDFYGSHWKGDASLSDGAVTVSPAQNKKTFTNYNYPYRLPNGEILAYKASFDMIGGFYQIDDKGHEKLIRNQGRVLDNYYSYKNNKLVWAELGQDERWSWKSYSNIVVYDMLTSKRHRITSSTKYFSPDISNDGNRLIVFEVTPELRYSLIIISAENGEPITQLPNPENYYFSYPKWSMDENHIFVQARNGSGQVALLSVNVASGRYETLVPFTNHQLGIPFETSEYVFIAVSFTGVDNIFALEKSTKKLYQVTNGSLGSYQPFVDEAAGELFFSRFTGMGNDILSIKISSDSWIEFKPVEPTDSPSFDFISLKEEGTDITQKIPDKPYETIKYPIGSKLINIHSWSLYFEDPNYEWAIKSNNILNTLNMSAGVRYNRNDEAFTYFYNAEYAQFYPVLFLSASTGQRNVPAVLVDEDGNMAGSVNISWWESIIRPGVSIPLNLSSGLYTRQLNLTGYYSYSNVNFSSETIEKIPEIEDFSYDSYTTGFSFINRRKKARQNIFAKYSQYLTLSYDRLLDREKVDQLFVDSEWTFPGLSANHNLVFQAAVQQEDPEKFPRFGDNFFYSRGYNRPVYDLIYKVGSNYHFQLAYPDWGFWGMAYLYRIRANVFFDYSRAHFTSSESPVESIQMYNSTGVELIFDTRLLNLYDFTFGIRYSYLFNRNPYDANLKHTYEFFIPVVRF